MFELQLGLWAYASLWAVLTCAVFGRLPLVAVLGSQDKFGRFGGWIARLIIAWFLLVVLAHWVWYA